MSNDTQVKQEVPERVWIEWSEREFHLKPLAGYTEYVRADLLATVRREAFKEAVDVVTATTDELIAREEFGTGVISASVEILETLERASANQKGEVNG